MRQPITDAAKEHGVSVETLYRLIRLGKLKRYRKFGDRRTFVESEELKAALEFREEPP
jgi:excisionase family DNA binding protein